MEDTIYKECIKRGIPVNNHESDLYIPVTAETAALVKFFDKRPVSTFVNQVEGGLWYDIAFAFEPWWIKRTGRA